MALAWYRIVKGNKCVHFNIHHCPVMLALQAIIKLERFAYIHSETTEYKNRLLEIDATNYENGPECTGIWHLKRCLSWIYMWLPTLMTQGCNKMLYNGYRTMFSNTLVPRGTQSLSNILFACLGGPLNVVYTVSFTHIRNIELNAMLKLVEQKCTTFASVK